MLINAFISLFSGDSIDLSSVVAQIISILFIIAIILPLHECAHGWVAVKLGDNTPKWDKRLTLNPLASIDPMGALAMLLFGFGWAKPVSVNPRNFRNPKRDMAIVAIAGPISNLLAALVGAMIITPFGIYAPANVITTFIYYLLYFYIYVNISLAVFNLLPIPPLDGSRIVAAFLSDKAMMAYYRYQRYIVMGLFVLLWIGALSVPLAIARSFFSNIVYFIAELPYALLGII